MGRYESLLPKIIDYKYLIKFSFYYHNFEDLLMTFNDYNKLYDMKKWGLYIGFELLECSKPRCILKYDKSMNYFILQTMNEYSYTS